MNKIIVIIFIMLSLSAIMIMPSYSDDQCSDEDLRVFEGTVVNVDVGKSMLTVNGTTQIDFPISLDTTLKKDIYDIKLSDINKGDYVTVQYCRQGSDSRVPLKVINVTVEYGPEKW